MNEDEAFMWLNSLPRRQKNLIEEFRQFYWQLTHEQQDVITKWLGE